MLSLKGNNKMISSEINQVITFIPKNNKPKIINNRYFQLFVLDPRLLKIRLLEIEGNNSNEEDEDFIIRCIDAENLAEVINISFFDNKQSMEIENIEVYKLGEIILENDIVSNSLVPVFKNVYPIKEEITLTLYSILGDQCVININDIKTLNFNSDDIYITIITNNSLYRIVASNCKSIYSILEDSVVINPRDIVIEGIIFISSTLEEFREDNFKYSLNAQVLD